MPTATPTRKSGRQRVPNKKYTVDAFEGLGLLGSDSEHEIEILQESEKRAAKDDREGQDDFSGDELIAEPPPEDDDPISVDEESEGSGIATPDEIDEEALDSDTAGPAGSVRPGRKSQPLPRDEFGHSRGMNEASLKYVRNSDAVFIEQVMGSNLEEQASFQRTRDKWAGNISLPTKRVNRHGHGGMDYPLHYSTEQRNMEATVGWDWYYDDGGRAVFQAKQIIEALSVDDGVKYIPKPSKSTQRLLLGPYSKQRMFTLSLMQSLSLDEAWKLARMTVSSTPDDVGKRPGKRQDGWMLNVGAGIRCLEWAPNHPKETQYLAISTLLPQNSQAEQSQPNAPAYNPSQSYPSSIQFWAFDSVEASGKTSYLPPEFKMVICTEWGHAKQLKWCPMPRNTRIDEDDRRIYLGLLAGVWSDGCMRVLDVYLPDGNTRYVKYKAAVFEARPPSTVCTCITWLSPTDIAVGCANGYLAVWDICPKASPSRGGSLPNNRPINNSTPPRPYMYLPIHQSYILAITNAYPPHPYMLCTSSLSGHVRLTDIRSPVADSIFGAHIRIGPSSLTYCAHLSCFLTTHEDGQFVRALPLRRFWANVGLARSESELLSISAAPLHPTILCGHANGTLLAFNPLRRYLGGKLRNGQPQHKLWQHEWAQNKQIEQEEQAEQGEREGVSRITEGYKVDDAWLHQDFAKPVKGTKGRHRIDELAPTSTIYEEASGIKEISWNPNLAWGGWAATGMGSGLVRVEDLSI